MVISGNISVKALPRQSPSFGHMGGPCHSNEINAVRTGEKAPVPGQSGDKEPVILAVHIPWS